MLLSNHSAPSPPAGRETRSRWQRIRARLRVGKVDGQALIELALCMPVLLIVITGTFAFGITFANYVALTNATGTATMAIVNIYGQLPPPYDPCAYTVSAFEGAAPNLKPASLTFSLVLNGTTYSGNSTLSCTSASNLVGAAGNLFKPFSTVKLTVTYPCSVKVYASNYLPNCSLIASTSEEVP